MDEIQLGQPSKSAGSPTMEFEDLSDKSKTRFELLLSDHSHFTFPQKNQIEICHHISQLFEGVGGKIKMLLEKQHNNSNH